VSVLPDKDAFAAAAQLGADPRLGILGRLRALVIGKPRSLSDRSVFHQLSLIAFFAWVGMGADGMSSSCYGPAEAFLELRAHPHLAFFVALGTAVTIFVISASYCHIIDLFPSGGGGYLVASKLLSPTAGMVSGCALLIDYVLTISVSVASCMDAIFSFLPPPWHAHKFAVGVAGVLLLTVMNLRGVKESIIPLVPIFLVFVLTHLFAIGYALATNGARLGEVAAATSVDVSSASGELGIVGMLILILRAYSMGAGTFTGIEAVSNGMAILREPRVKTAKTTMRYMAWSLAVTAMGLMLAYVLLALETPPEGKTFNALLFERISAHWPAGMGASFVLVTLVSEGAILFVAAQTGFLDGPRVIANMAADRWMPSRFALLSERLVTKNGIVVMGLAALVTMVLTGGDVRLLVILYSINVFITFCLSQLGMVRHWWSVRGGTAPWRGKLLINGLGLVLCTFILVSVTLLKFHQGGWVTLVITGSLAGVALLIRRHYNRVGGLLTRLNDMLRAIPAAPPAEAAPPVAHDPRAKTAVLLVSGFNGIGMHSLLNTIRYFGETFRNFAFVQVGMIDAGNFKGIEELANLERHTRAQLGKYVAFCRANGLYAEAHFGMGVDVIEEIAKLAPAILERYPDAVFFGGQLVFPQDSAVNRWLHNAAVFAIQRRFYTQGIPFMILPIRV
jgi:amino acid transporter